MVVKIFAQLTPTTPPPPLPTTMTTIKRLPTVLPKTEKVEKLAPNLHDIERDVIHIGNLNRAVNHRLVLKKIHRVIKFNQKSWFNPYINMSTELTKNQKIILKNIFLS